jgi:hypothetical protein
VPELAADAGLAAFGRFCSGKCYFCSTSGRNECEKDVRILYEPVVFLTEAMVHN